jgi:hypothetical protein
MTRAGIVSVSGEGGTTARRPFAAGRLHHADEAVSVSIDAMKEGTLRLGY